MASLPNDNGTIIVYQREDGSTGIDVHFVDETVWLSQQQMAELFQRSRTNVVEHIKNIYVEGELEENSTCRKFRQVRQEGNREVSREIPYYNLDMIISLGYRIRSKVATHFRRWAEQLKEYMIKGFTMNDERLKSLGGGSYWKELLDRKKKLCIDKYWIYMLLALIMILIVENQLLSLKWYRKTSLRSTWKYRSRSHL